MIRALWLLWLAVPLSGQNICVESALSTNNEAVRQNKSGVEGLAQILIDDVFKANDVRYYEYFANSASRTDCAHIVFMFDKPDAGEWVVRARIERTYAAALNEGPAIIERCTLGFTKPGKLEDFEWRKAVQDNIMHCFGEAFRLQEKKDLLYKFALVARNVQDHCYEGVQTRSCLVLPLPFAPPFNRLAKASFRIVSPYEYGGEFDVNGFARGQCAKFSDQTMGDLSRIKADLDALAPALNMMSPSQARDDASKRLADATRIVGSVAADSSKLPGVPAALADLAASLRQLNPVPDAADRLEKDGLRLEANRLIKPIDKAIVVNLERGDIEMADWAFSRVEVLRVDDNIPDRCDPWREPPAKAIPFQAPAAPPRTPPGGQN